MESLTVLAEVTLLVKEQSRGLTPVLTSKSMVWFHLSPACLIFVIYLVIPLEITCVPEFILNGKHWPC